MKYWIIFILLWLYNILILILTILSDTFLFILEVLWYILGFILMWLLEEIEFAIVTLILFIFYLLIRIENYGYWAFLWLEYFYLYFLYFMSTELGMISLVCFLYIFVSCFLLYLVSNEKIRFKITLWYIIYIENKIKYYKKKK